MVGSNRPQDQLESSFTALRVNVHCARPVNRSPRSGGWPQLVLRTVRADDVLNRPGFGFRLEAELAQTNEDAGKIMDDFHLGMCSNLQRLSACFWFDCSDFSLRILPRYIVQTISGGRVSGLAKKMEIF